MHNTPKRIKYKGQIYERITEDYSSMYEVGPKENTIIKNGVVYGAYNIPMLDAHQGEYINGAYVPALHPVTGEVMLPETMIDEWEW